MMGWKKKETILDKVECDTSECDDISHHCKFSKESKRISENRLIFGEDIDVTLIA